MTKTIFSEWEGALKNKRLKILVLLLFLLSLICTALHASDKRSIVPEDVLGMSLEEMMNVKITTAGKKAEKIADIPASVVIITRNDIEKYGYMSLEEILENVPGMYVIDDLGAYRKTFGVRGFYSGNPRNIIFLVNGVSQAEGVFDFNVMANFNIPVEAIDRIEVVRGPMSVMYGQGAFFGTINIITNDSYDETSLASVSYGNMTQKAAAKIAGTEGNFKYSLSAGYSDSEGPDHRISDMTSDISKLAGSTDPGHTTEDQLERDSVNVIFSGKYKKFYTDAMFNRSKDEAIISVPAIGDGSRYNRDSGKFALGYKDQVSNRVTIDAKFTYHHARFSLDWDITNNSFSGDAGESGGEADMYEFEVDAFVNVLDNLDLTSGIYYKRYDDPAFQADVTIFGLNFDDSTDEDIQQWAAFTQANYLPTDKLRIVAGLRLEQQFDYTMIHDTGSTVTTEKYDQDDIELVKSIAAIYSFNNRHVLKLLYGEAIARPSYFQNRDQFLSGKPNLASEEIRTFEINYIATLSQKVTFNFSLFHNILDNLIVRTSQLVGGNLVQFSSNGGKLVTSGTEVSIQARPIDKLFADISFTYQNTENERTGFEHIDVAYSPHFLGYAKLTYEVTNDVLFSLTGTYVDDMETEWQEAGGRVGNSVDGYFLLGANLRFNSLFSDGFYLNIRGSNVLDKDYHYPTYLNNTWAEKGTPGMPFEILATVGVKF